MPQIVSRIEDWVISALHDCGIDGERNDAMMGFGSMATRFVPSDYRSDIGSQNMDFQ